MSCMVESMHKDNVTPIMLGKCVCLEGSTHFIWMGLDTKDHNFFKQGFYED